MKKTVICIFTLCLTTSIFSSLTFAQNSNDKSAGMEKAKEWLKSREWAGGMTLNVHNSVNVQEFSNQYHRNKSYWDIAFSYLKNTNFDNIAPGKYNLDGDNVYAIVSEGPVKAFADTRWESHRNYIDIQYVIRGKEKMGIAPLSKASVTEAYNVTKDIAFHNVPDADGQYYTAEPGTFLIFFPGDAHRPGIKTEGTDSDKKVVIKVRSASQ